jgi:hypothetical protein
MTHQPILFDDIDDEVVSAEFLRDRGYLVFKPSKHIEKYNSGESKFNLKSNKDLVKFFYIKMMEYNPGRKLHYSMSTKEDLKNAKKLVEKRMALGVSKKRALIEAALIIDILVKHEALFGVAFPITSLRPLVSEKTKWIVDKVIAFYNGEKSAERELYDLVQEEYSNKQKLNNKLKDR